MNIRTLIATLAVTLLLSSQAFAKNTISGTVSDRNGTPIARTLITIAPGNMQIVTDEEGHFLLDYLRDDQGKRTKLKKKTNYSIEAFKVGYHIERKTFFYKRGEIALDSIMLIEDTIEVDDDGRMIDPTLYVKPTQSTGVNYEGE